MSLVSAEIIEWIAFGIGTIGTVLWATRHPSRLEGWFWFASAVFWIWFAILSGHAGLAARDILGMMLYVVGIWKRVTKKQDS